ncbi:MAG: hypothetical protein COB38_06345 [Gammaproteobacteria bacterium]|nr:MAG: hypothetical protein COB38_06345 [Gammaproteobacteria bacterium]
MQLEANRIDDYLAKVPKDRQPYFSKLHEVVVNNLPKGFEVGMGSSMITYFVPHSIYPNGYHCKPSDPLPFVSLGVQKNFIGFYHMGIYADPALKDWFVEEYGKQCKYKLDMGKSCIRLKKPEFIPIQLFGELIKKMSCEEWIEIYESQIKR